MRNFLLAATAIVALMSSAEAGVIDYTFHQTSASYPGLNVSGHYRVDSSVPLHYADSTEASPNFGGLIDFYIEGGGYPLITLADLIPSCMNSSGCDIGGGKYHDFGSPNWHIKLPGLFYVQAISSLDGYHFEWDYQVSSSFIQINDDNAASACFEQFGCYAKGYWTFSYAPEPASAAALIGGLALLGGFRRRRSMPS